MKVPNGTTQAAEEAAVAPEARGASQACAAKCAAQLRRCFGGSDTPSDTRHTRRRASPQTAPRPPLLHHCCTKHTTDYIHPAQPGPRLDSEASGQRGAACRVCAGAGALQRPPPVAGGASRSLKEGSTQVQGKQGAMPGGAPPRAKHSWRAAGARGAAARPPLRARPPKHSPRSSPRSLAAQPSAAALKQSRPGRAGLINMRCPPVWTPEARPAE